MVRWMQMRILDTLALGNFRVRVKRGRPGYKSPKFYFLYPVFG